MMLRIIILLATVALSSSGGDSHLTEEATLSDHRNMQGCDIFSEQTCMKCGYETDGSPRPEYFCASISDDCPNEVCCNIHTEEKCYDDITGDPTSCKRYDEGGCPCPSGETKCGVSEYSSGYCTTLCCDWTIEQTCYDSNREPISCRRYEDGPCPTPTISADDIVESSTNPSTSEQPSSMPSVQQSESEQPTPMPSSQPSNPQFSLRGKKNERTVRKGEQEHSLRLWHRKEHLGGERF